MIRETLKKSIQKTLAKLGLESAEIRLEHPEDFSHGDYSTNIAMVLGKINKQNPKDLAAKITAELSKKLPKEISKVEVAGPGFINFYLSEEFFANGVKAILKEKDKFGQNKSLKGEKTIIEYTDPNPFKEFHIGHLMPNAIGEAVSRIVEANGAKVKRVNYQGDVGLHVAKAIWAIQKQRKDIKKMSVYELGQSYAFGAKAYEENDANKKEIVAINKKIYEGQDREINEIYKIGRTLSLDYFETIYKILGTKFDKYFFESETGSFGKKIVEKNLGKVFEKGENGAIIFKGENYGLHTRVFVNGEGLPTYEAKELGLSEIKHDFFSYQKSIIVTGNDINAYFKVLLKAMSLIFPKLAASTVHLSHGLLRLPSGKMSSRTGDVITTLSLIEEVKNKVSEKMSDREFSEAEKQAVVEHVAIGAIKYSILHQSIGKDIIFDFDKSLSFEGDSGPYLQYSYARARSILKKAKEEGIKPDQKNISHGVYSIEKILYRFPEVVERAAKEYSPHYIALYLIELASSFNNFYSSGKIVDVHDSASPYKIALTEAFSIILKNGLNLLGIEAPEKM